MLKPAPSLLQTELAPLVQLADRLSDHIFRELASGQKYSGAHLLLVFLGPHGFN